MPPFLLPGRGTRHLLPKRAPSASVIPALNGRNSFTIPSLFPRIPFDFLALLTIEPAYLCPSFDVSAAGDYLPPGPNSVYACFLPLSGLSYMIIILRFLFLRQIAPRVPSPASSSRAHPPVRCPKSVRQVTLGVFSLLLFRKLVIGPLSPPGFLFRGVVRELFLGLPRLHSTWLNVPRSSYPPR